MKDFVLAIDYAKCTGCRICEMVCTTMNNGGPNPEKARIRIVKIQEEADVLSIPVVCMKCVKPACKAVCPNGAISDDPSTGARVVDDQKCIGCSACVYACPFGAIAVDRTLQRADTCQQCEGDPTCVRFCPTDAIQYLEANEVSIKLRRSGLNKYVDFVKTVSE
ncbi:MAG: 4Fe-4S dicluster domain-containing protein [Deltaproteobacteria bacterium]|nr:4Fe-4S dicluster domain-containing protein [Deltaproteobacteria bacterium]